jgi:hypothetical protein
MVEARARAMGWREWESGGHKNGMGKLNEKIKTRS